MGMRMKNTFPQGFYRSDNVEKIYGLIKIPTCYQIYHPTRESPIIRVS